MYRKSCLILVLGISVFYCNLACCLSYQGPPTRRHVENESKPLSLVDANRKLPVNCKVSLTKNRDKRYIKVNGIPEHSVGRFPNRGNPHSIKTYSVEYELPLTPKTQDVPSPLEMGFNFGVGLNGVAFDPGAAEFWLGQSHLGWQYEVLGGAFPMGLDKNHAHVQPSGKYHYHGLPTGLLETLNVNPETHSPIVGWAADGFPIYALYGYSNARDSSSTIKQLRSSYRLRTGNRPDQGLGPGGKYDGTFTRDYQFDAAMGDLDQCNGRFCVTPEFPQGTYAYFLTEHWPSIPRMHRGIPDPSFRNEMRRGPGRGLNRGGSFGPQQRTHSGPGSHGPGRKPPSGRPPHVPGAG